MSEMSQFDQLLADVNFPMHIPTYRAALGRPFSQGKWPMKKSDAIRMGRGALFSMIHRKWHELNEEQNIALEDYAI